ncbi:MAG: LuxR C-terminal-related transcriptional regulator [Anaerolineae bacterium]|jgi:LuxR family maltose regulon positive regulatory protein
MATSIHIPHIRTKLSVPVLRPDLVERPSLNQMLDRCISHRLMLISAPAGSGKTTLLSQWAQRCRWPIAWVSLDAADDDPVRFWSYLVAALDGLEPSLGPHLLPMLHSSRPETGGYLVATLINFLSRISDPFVLVLDDYHCIESEAVHTSLTTLLDYAPASMHLILSSRKDPPLPLARWRAREHMIELRAPDLRFSPEETRALLERTIHSTLSDHDVAGLQTWIEGWAAGVQLAALTIEQQRAHRPDFALPELRQDGRHLRDYFAAEVLDRQSDAVRTFLLRTSILDTLNASLCDRVTGQSHSHSMLDDLYRRNLFITALDRRGEYRYHRLFADFLRTQARRDLAAEWPALHGRAADWYEQHGLFDEAIDHALAAGQVARATDLIHRLARECVMRGESATVLRWLRALPDDAILDQPYFCLMFAWALANSGQGEAAIPYLERIESTEHEGSEASLLLGEAATVRARIAALQGDASRHARYAQRALDLLPADALLMRSDALLDLAFAHRDGLNLDRAEEAFWKAIRSSRAAGNVRTTMMSVYYLGDTYMEMGQAAQAARIYQQGLDWCRQSVLPSTLACWAHAGFSALLYEWNDLSEADVQLRRALDLGQQNGEPKPLMYARITLACLLQSRGQHDEALAVLDDAGEIADQTRIVQIDSQIKLTRIKLWLRQGRRDMAAAWLRRHGLDVADEAFSDDELTTLAWFYLTPAEGEPLAVEAVRRLVGRIRSRYEIAVAHRLIRRQVDDSIILALAHHELGDDEEALACMERALTAAEPMGLLRTFADWPHPAVGALLRRLARQDDTGYRRRLLDALAAAPAPQSTSDQPSTTDDDRPPIEALHPREIEILRHIARGLSDQEIADEMILAVSTVKWYLRNLYGKLGVNRRTQALARARAMGLFSD